MAIRVWGSWENVVSDATFFSLTWLGWNVEPTSDVSKDWPGVSSPAILITSLIFYISVVAFGRVHLKRGYSPGGDSAWLRAFVILHNVLLIILSAYMCAGCITEAYRNDYTLWGNEYKPDQVKLAKLIYLFFISKIYEFVDTFIMILKGNWNQVSFLHVYHHATISFIWWMIVRVAPGGDAYFSAALNSWVHVCMYTYYLLAIVVGKDVNMRNRYLWWGRYLTQMQMFQFVLNLFQALYCSKYSAYPRFLSHILLVYMGSLLVLFGRFYYSKHISTPRSLDSKKLK